LEHLFTREYLFVTRKVAGFTVYLEMLMRALMLASCSVLLVSCSFAWADPLRSVSIAGAGRDSCSKWLSDRAATSTEARAATQARIEWISGFLSAVNLFADRSGNLKGGIDALDAALKWIDSYCSAHPVDPLWTAAGTLVLDLRNHARE